jgi:hypothetical protein
MRDFIIQLQEAGRAEKIPSMARQKTTTAVQCRCRFISTVLPMILSCLRPQHQYRGAVLMDWHRCIHKHKGTAAAEIFESVETF